MRALLFLSVALVAFAPAATAQDPDGAPGCVEANPCEIIIAVDELGLSDVSETEFTTGDWLVATIVNHDDVAHTIRLGDHDLDVTTAPGDVDDSAPFKVGPVGTYSLTDTPTNDVETITVVAEDEFGEDPSDGGSSSEGRGSPGLAPLALLAGLLAALVVARRQA
jgi:hypothetical protein